MAHSQRVLKQSCGFTLIELLVASGVIAVLVGLLLPAVQQAREAARRTCCRNNLKQLGLALHQYHDVHARFPPGSLLGNIHNVNEMLLPFMEQSALYQQIDFGVDNITPENSRVLAEHRLAYQVCPSNPQGTAIGQYDGLLSQGAAYQTCAGPYRFPLGPDKASDCYQAGLPDFCAGASVAPTSGMFGLAIAAPNYASRIRDVTDGLSQTIMLGEVLPQLNLFHGLWSAQAYGFTTTMKPNSHSSKRPITTVIPSVSYQDALNLNHGLFSAHAGGAHVVRGDGGVMYLNDSIDFATYNFLGNKGDGVSISDF